MEDAKEEAARLEEEVAPSTTALVMTEILSTRAAALG
jgi:hypothetical protein